MVLPSLRGEPANLTHRTNRFRQYLFRLSVWSRVANFIATASRGSGSFCLHHLNTSFGCKHGVLVT